MKDYQKVQTNLIDMLEDLEELEKSLDEILSLNEAMIIELQKEEEDEIETEVIVPELKPRFEIKSGKISSK